MMDEKSNELLSQILSAQKEQTELLRRYLWRFRFSLLSLLLLTTGTAVGLGALAYQNHKQSAATVVPTAATGTIWTGSSGTLQLYSAPPTVTTTIQMGTATEGEPK
jgi:hypothetical protein